MTDICILPRFLTDFCYYRIDQDQWTADTLTADTSSTADIKGKAAADPIKDIEKIDASKITLQEKKNIKKRLYILQAFQTSQLKASIICNSRAFQLILSKINNVSDKQFTDNDFL